MLGLRTVFGQATRASRQSRPALSIARRGYAEKKEEEVKETAEKSDDALSAAKKATEEAVEVQKQLQVCSPPL